MNISRKPLTLILLLAFLAMPFTVSADVASDTVAAIAANPANAAEIVSDAIKDNPDLAAAIVAAVIKANPGLAVAVTTAAVKAAPDKAAAIIIAAVAEAPKQASAIGAAALAAAPGQSSAIVSALVAAVGATLPTQAYSELMTNNLALQTEVTVAAIAACGGGPACKTSVLAQVAAQTNPATAAAITRQVDNPASQS